MTHKKAVRYFKPRKKTPIKTTFRLMRAGFWRSVYSVSQSSYARNRIRRIILESLARDGAFNSTLVLQKWLGLGFTRLTRRSAAPKLKLRCIFVGRARATNQDLFMTRHTFRRFLRLGLMPGFIKITKL